MPPDDFWDGVRRRWHDAVALINHPTAVDTGQMKRMWRYSLRRTTVPIAVTGTRGCGKTTLYDALLGRISHTYTPPGMSKELDPDKAILRGAHGGRVRSSVYVIPGQSDLRHGVDGDLFKDGNYPSGLIHVAAWGFGTPWQDAPHTIRRELEASDVPVDLATVQQHQQDLELEAFQEVCTLLRACWRRRSDVWLVIAAAKCDLYWGEIDEAARYYLPDQTDAVSEFHAELRGLVNHLGEASLSRLAVVPVCMYPETFRFDHTVVERAPALGYNQSSSSVRNLLSIVGEFCGLR